MKPKHSHDLEVGDILQGELPCGCVWVYAKFYPPAFRLVEKCKACEQQETLSTEARAEQETETFSEFANPSLAYYLIYGTHRIVYNADTQSITYYTAESKAISEQLSEGVKVCLKKDVDTFAIGTLAYAVSLQQDSLLYVSFQVRRTQGAFSDGNSVVLQFLIP